MNNSGHRLRLVNRPRSDLGTDLQAKILNCQRFVDIEPQRFQQSLGHVQAAPRCAWI